MYQVSSEFLNVMKRPAQKRTCRGTISDIPFTNKNILQNSVTITNQCSDNSNIQIGQVYIGQLNIVLRGLDIPRKSYKGRKIVLYQGLYLDSQNIEEIPLGHYFVEEAIWTMSGVSITAYDSMTKFDKNLTNAFVTFGSIYELVDLACLTCGVVLGTTKAEFLQFPNGNLEVSIYGENDMETWRDLISWCAQTVGCNATINRNGELVFIRYTQNITDTYSPKRRLEGANFSDYDTFYTGISMVNIAEMTTSYYGLDEDNGLTMNLGSNPLLQYGTERMLEQQRRNILNAVAVIDYTPAVIRLNALMIYDLMDVLEFTGGLAGGIIKVCITKFTWKLNGDYIIECVGSDPSLASARSKVDKNLVGLLSKIDENEMHYYDYVNTREINIINGRNADIVKIRYATRKETHIDFHGEINYTLSTIENDSVGSDYVQENDGKIRVTYFLEGEEVVEYHPIETNTDGKHLLHLLYTWQRPKDINGIFIVSLQAVDCSVNIEIANSRGYIAGQGLIGQEAWDGTVYADEEFGVINFNSLLPIVSDSLVSVSKVVPIPINKVEQFGVINFNSLIPNNIVDSVVGMDSDEMIFSAFVNLQLLVYTATISNGMFIDGEIVTPNVSGIDNIIVVSNSATFYVSFDNELTWVAYSTSDGWVEGSSMTSQELESIPSSAWTGPAKIKIVLETGSSFTQMIIKGGYV